MREYTEQDVEKAVKGYVIYLRKSREDLDAEKRGEMETLARHEKILLSLTEEQGLTVAKVYKEVVSGETIQDRPQMQEMMKEVYAGKYTGVIVVKPDRLSRGDLENMGYIMNGLKFSGTLLVTPGMTYDVTNNKFHEQMLEMQLFNSKQEYRAIVARMHEGKMLSFREGNYMGSKPPYGYDLYEPDKWTRTLKPNESAPIVVRMFEWFVNERISPWEIAKRLYDLGIPSCTGNPEWHRASVKEVLKNHTYMGKNRWYRRKQSRVLDDNGAISKKKQRAASSDFLIVQGKHQAIITEEMFEAAQELFTGSVPKHAGAKVTNPLSGLLKCAHCGKTLRYQKVSYPGSLPRLVHPESQVCHQKSSHVQEVMGVLCEALKQYIEDFEFKVSNAGRLDEIARHKEDVARIETELETAKKKRRRLFDDYEEGIYTKEEFAERKGVWADRIERLSNALEELHEVKPEEIDYSEKAAKFTEALEAIQNPTTSAKEINNLLKAIIERIDYHCEDLGHLKGGIITLDVVLKK